MTNCLHTAAAYPDRLWFSCLRMVEEMPLERSVAVSYETIRWRAMKFGCLCRHLWRKAPSPKDVWHLDEVVVVQARHNTKAAKRLLSRLMKNQGACQSGSSPTSSAHMVARRPLMPTVEHRSHRGLNNRVENSHLPLRKREGSCSGSVRRERCNASPLRVAATPQPLRRARPAFDLHLHPLAAMAHWKAITGPAA